MRRSLALLILQFARLLRRVADFESECREAEAG